MIEHVSAMFNYFKTAARNVDILFLRFMLYVTRFELAAASPDNHSHIQALRQDITRNEGRLQRLLIERIYQ